MNCRNFRPTNLFQMEVIRHMNGRFLHHKEKELLKKIFDALDEERDGELESEEFRNMFQEKFNLQLSKKDMLRMLKFIDFGGGDGLIQFTEFLIAGSNKAVLFKEENCQKEFKFLDLDQDGFIGLEDIETFMTGICREVTLKKSNNLQNIKQMLKEIKRAYAQWKLENQI